MSPRLLLITAACTLACTHTHTTNISSINCDTLPEQKTVLPATAVSVAVDQTANKEISHKLPFFKEVLDFKRLYW